MDNEQIDVEEEIIEDTNIVKNDNFSSPGRVLGGSSFSSRCKY
jgi:hypothetical protein